MPDVDVEKFLSQFREKLLSRAQTLPALTRALGIQESETLTAQVGNIIYESPTLQKEIADFEKQGKPPNFVNDASGAGYDASLTAGRQPWAHLR